MAHKPNGWHNKKHTKKRNDVVAELRAHVGEMVDMAIAGDYSAREWLLQNFDGNREQLICLWRQPSEGVQHRSAQMILLEVQRD